ncbi:MAG: DUF3237 domain-containing protein [Alphaproteobacteria bacterium]|nr:DUF3237 domain-containing protein [Alphaproteobacteria bacterium]
MTPTPGIRSELLFTITLQAGTPMRYGATPIGERIVVPVAGGHFQGPKLKGRIMPGGGDWLIHRPDGCTELNVRMPLQTDDGADISMTYRGYRFGPADVLERHWRGEVIERGQYYFRIASFFETAAPEYAWLNTIIAIGVGERRADGPGYDVYQIL